jgi:hypothetical protein
VKSGAVKASSKNAAVSLAADSAALRTAIANLDSHSDVELQGFALISTAVSMQTNVPVETVRRQHSITGMSYGELLIANTLAKTSGKSFDAIMAMKSKSRSWGELAGKVGVSEGSIIAKAHSATDSLTFAEAKSERRRQQNVRDTIDTAHPGNLGNAPGGG